MNSARMLGFGVWRSLVARLVRDEKVEGSNPFTPTNYFPPLSAFSAASASARGTTWLVPFLFGISLLHIGFDGINQSVKIMDSV